MKTFRLFPLSSKPPCAWLLRGACFVGAGLILAGCRTSDSATNVPPPPEPLPAPSARPLDTQAIPGTTPRLRPSVAQPAMTVSLEGGSLYFGAYDSIMTASIRERWNLLRGSRPDPKPFGRATVSFRQNADGRVSNVIVQENTLGEDYRSLCEDAVSTAYHRSWSSEMREKIGADHRDLRVTFLWQGIPVSEVRP